MLKPGDILQQGRYRIVRHIARGGMGAVYEAREERLARSIALKETLVRENDLPHAFQREAKLLANLSHPALPRVFDHFDENDSQYMVMEFIPGDDLAERLRDQGHPFSVAEVLPWYDQLLDALEYLHEHTIVHRDLKPSNLKVKEKGGIILLDFGLAKGDAGLMTVISRRSIPGYTLTYAPPEQIHCEGTTARSDLYSLGATMYHLLTNIAPPDASKRELELLKNRADPLRPLAEVRPDLPSQLTAVLTQALKLEAEERPVDAAAMRVVLPLPPPPVQPVGPSPYPEPKPVPRPVIINAGEPTVPSLEPPATEPGPNEFPPVKPSPRPYIPPPPLPSQPQVKSLIRLGLAITVALAALALFIWFMVAYISPANETKGTSQSNNKSVSNQNNQPSPTPTDSKKPLPIKTVDPNKVNNMRPIQ